jgi:hypothetical protein
MKKKIIYSYISLQIISKGYAKILETLKTFPLLFSTFSFPFLFLPLFTVLKKIEWFITKTKRLPNVLG